VVAGVAGAVLLAACTTQANPSTEPPAGAASEPGGSSRHGRGHPTPADADDAQVPLRPGESVVDVAMPVAYAPSAVGNGSDDYRCFLLDPDVDEDAFVTGVDVVPGAPEMVHHVILFRVPPAEVADAEAKDATDPGQGWTCFGGTGLGGEDLTLESAPWLGAWAPGSGGRPLADDIGIPIAAGSRIVMQVHYNLTAGSSSDRSRARLRVTDGDSGLQPLETMLLPAPVELPCRPAATGALCDRDAAVADVVSRFGMASGAAVAGLQLLCGGRGVEPGPTQSCRRTVQAPATIRGAAGHMHLLGRSIRIRVDPGTEPRTVLDIPVWDFDDQGTRMHDRPVRIAPGDELEVTCTHDQALRDLLPAFQGQPERYVLWGEGTTDEMCLGIVLVTRP
jgi:hypothetical protein